MDVIIIHDAQNQRFVSTNKNLDSYLKYYVSGDTIDFASTYVPTELRGFGIAQKLVEEGLKFAKENNYKIIPSCWYVEGYMKKKNLL